MTPMPSRPPLSLVLLAAALALGPACAQTVRIKVHSTPETNAGEVFYMMVRATDDDFAFNTEDYASAASRVHAAAAKDESVQKVQAVVPGKPLSFSVPRTAREKIALYFFFTRPGPYWKWAVGPPIPAEIRVELDTQDIKAVKTGQQ
jgi:hypothetical protein